VEKRSNPASARPAKPLGDPAKELRALYGLDSRALRDFSLVSPQCSLAFGASGIAYALARAGEILHDSEFLLAADAWIEAAEQHAPNKQAFISLAQGCTRRKIGFASIVFGEPGLFYVKTMIRSCMGDPAGADGAARKFLTLSESRLSRVADVHLGGLGLALAAKHLVSCASSVALRSELSNFSRRIVRRAWVKTGSHIRCNQVLGFAHGIAGQVFATYACGDPKLASPILQQLREMAIPHHRTILWPVRAGSRDVWTGWCNGVAGHLLMWTKVWQHSRAHDDRELIEQIARAVWKHQAPLGSLCCGAAGQAVALASFSAATGDHNSRKKTVAWLRSFRPRWPKGSPPQSLFQGKLGLLLARVECEHAKRPEFPIYQRDSLSAPMLKN